MYYFEYGAPLGQHFKIKPSRCTAKHKPATFGTIICFESTKQFRLGSILNKWRYKHPLPLERCPASTPEPIAIVLMSKCPLQCVSVHLEPLF